MQLFDFTNKHPSVTRVLLALTVGFIAGVGSLVLEPQTGIVGILGMLALVTVIVAIAVGYPVALTVSHLVRTTKVLRGKPIPPSDAGLDVWTLFVAGVYEIGYLIGFKEVEFRADWHVQLVNSQTHTPIFTQSWPLIMVVLLLFVAGFFALRFNEAGALPPLITVLSIAAVYLGTALAVVWTIQIVTFTNKADAMLILPLVVLLAIVVKVVALQVRNFEVEIDRRGRVENSRVLGKLDSVLVDAKRWPLLGLAFVLPLLGLIVGVLALFGQSPSLVVRAFTETAEWNLSTEVAPQNVFFDEHYLCTVAAGGHRSVVKPLRMGRRHGNPVVVNRQLMVANAFEQVLEERVPRTHRVIRGLYDRYGLPVAKLIRSRWVADLVWVLMKPAEWIFLAVIYLTDRHPEDRIAVQYTA